MSNLGGNRFSATLRENLGQPCVLVYVILVAMLLIAQTISSGFLSVMNMNNILVQSSFLGLVAIGQTLVILTGGIDLSIASVVTLSNLVASEIMSGQDVNILPALAYSMLIGLLVGAVNGFCIQALKIPAIIMTLATGSVLQGVGLIYSKGAPKGYTAPLVKLFATGRFYGTVPYIVIFWGIMALLTIFLLRRTTFGRAIYAIGTNPSAAFCSGLNVTLTLVAVYAISGCVAGLTGALYVGYTNTSFLNAGNIFMMSSVAAVVVGGTSSAGGKGGYTGTVAGAIIMTVLFAILTIANVQEAGKKIMEGLIILLLVFVYSRK